MTSKIDMTKIFLVNKDSHINNTIGWSADYHKLSKNRCNSDFIEIVEKSNKYKNLEKYIIKEQIGLDNNDYDFKNNCFYSWNIKVVEIPTEYYEKKWYEIINRWDGRIRHDNHDYLLEQIQFFNANQDEELVLFHEKYRLSTMSPCQKQKVVLIFNTYYSEYSIIDIYREYLFENAQNLTLVPKMTDIEIRTSIEFIKWIENIQLTDTKINLENKIINLYRHFILEEKIDTYYLMTNIELQNNITFMEWVKDIRQLDVSNLYIDTLFCKWLNDNKQFDTFTKYNKVILFKRTFEIAEIDINIFNSNCFSIEISSNHKENIIILEDKYIIYKYMNIGKNILHDTSVIPEKKVELLIEFMSNIIEDPSTMFNLLKDRADFFPGYGYEYIDSFKRWNQSIEKKSI